MRTAEPLAALALASTLAVAGCGEEPASAPLPQPVTDQTHGLAVELPPGWERASGSLTPRTRRPARNPVGRDVPPARPADGVRPRRRQCARRPRPARRVRDAAGARPGSRRDRRDFPPRPAHFGPQLGDPSEASECAPGARFSDHWFAFTDGARHFHVLVAFGPQAPAGVRHEAWAILDGLRIDPRVRPDWRSSG